MRVVANSPYLEKAWMVYYDYDDRKWATITWRGFGKDNTIIGDTVFTRKNGLVNGSSSEDAPEFYFAYSEDNGRTWKPHEVNEAGIYCKKLSSKQRPNVVLISEPFLGNKQRTYLGIILQWNSVPRSVTTSSIINSLNFDFYCDVARDFSGKN